MESGKWLENHGIVELGQGGFRTIPAEKWRSFDWQFANRITSVEGLTHWREGLTGEKPLAIQGFPMSVTPYYSVLISKSKAAKAMAVPSVLEARDTILSFADPLAEEAYSPVPGLVHRYPDRVLLSVSSVCPVYCRYCTRRRYVGRPAKRDKKAWWQYISEHREIREVIVSGGEPLSLPDAVLTDILHRVRSMAHIQVIRLSTRVLAVAPCRITPGLAQKLSLFRPLFVLTQFNHPDECTLEAHKAARTLTQAGIPLLNQMVLLKGVNDDPGVIAELGRRLLIMGIKPYYLHQMDAVQGTSHFRVSVKKGIAIMRALRNEVSGLATPKYVIDLPDGGGKVSLAPEYAMEITGNKAWFVGTDNRLHEYDWEGDDKDF